MNERIFVSGPSITQKEVDYVAEAAKTAWYDNAGYYNDKFEKDFKAYVGRKYALSMDSCTSALHLSLLSLGVGPGDEVIVPDTTWIASAAAVMYVGAKIILADIDKISWCVSLDAIKKVVTGKTKAIILVDLYGNLPDFDEILNFAKENNIFVIEDAAQAVGCEYKGKKAGGFGETSVFSFHGSKLITTGEGGMFVTDDNAIYERALVLRDHGRPLKSDKMFWVNEIGWKFKMSSLQAALGIAQLSRVDEIVDYKNRIFSWYQEFIKDIDGISMNFVPDYCKSNYWMNTVVWDMGKYIKSKETVIKEFKDRFNVDARPFFYPLSSMPAFENLVPDNIRELNKNAYELSERSVNLPSGMDLSREKVQYVVECLKKIITDA